MIGDFFYMMLCMMKTEKKQNTAAELYGLR